LSQPLKLSGSEGMAFLLTFDTPIPKNQSIRDAL